MVTKIKEKKPRKASAYNLFFKDKYNSVKNLPPKDRMKAIAQMWNSMTIEEKTSYKK